MLASGITEHLASASGPLSGSGGALNQLGATANLGYNNYYPTGRDPYQQQQFETTGAAGGWAANTQPSGHTSRYEAHYSSARAAHQPAGRHHSAGAYFEPADQASRYYPSGLHAQQAANQHPSVASSGRFGSEPLDSRGFLFEPPGGATLASYRPASMQADSAAHQHQQLSGGGQPLGQPLGLGHYNPLDDPLLSSSANFGLGPTTSGLGPASVYAGQQQSQQQQWAAAAASMPSSNREAYVTELRARLHELQASYAAAKRELEMTTQKLGSSMHSIKSFWSPELKKERALRKEEQTKYALINDQMKLMRVEVQVSVSSSSFTSSRSTLHLPSAPPPRPQTTVPFPARHKHHQEATRSS